MNIVRAALALTAGTMAASAVSDRHKTAVGVSVALAVYWLRVGAEPGEPTWPWSAGGGGHGAKGTGDGADAVAVEDGRPFIDVEVPVNYVGPER